MSAEPFSPSAATVNTAVTGSPSSPVKICDQVGKYQIRMRNAGTSDTFVAFGGSTVSASISTSMPVAPGVEVITVIAPYNGPLYFATIASGSNGNFYITPGSGL